MSKLNKLSRSMLKAEKHTPLRQSNQIFGFPFYYIILHIIQTGCRLYLHINIHHMFAIKGVISGQPLLIFFQHTKNSWNWRHLNTFSKISDDPASTGKRKEKANNTFLL